MSEKKINPKDPSKTGKAAASKDATEETRTSQRIAQRTSQRIAQRTSQRSSSRIASKQII